MDTLYILIYAAIIVCLVLSGYSDYKTRTVSNVYPIAILLLGFFTPAETWLSKILGLILPMLLIIILNKITKQHSGGADIKMCLALGFAFGFAPFAFIIFGAALLAVIVSIIKRRAPKETIPMCTYLAISAIFYILYL